MALRTLGAAYALMWMTVGMAAGPGSAAIVGLTGKASWAGAFIALFFLGSAVGGVVGGRLMDTAGRRPVFVGAYLVAAVGYAMAGLGVANLGLFVAGTLVLAIGFGAVNLTRLAAGELVPPAERGRAVASVQWAATAGAIVGPLIIIASPLLGAWLGRPPLELVWWTAPPVLLVAAVLCTRLPHPWPVTPAGSDIGRGRVPAVAGMMCAHGAMIAVMGVAGAVVVAAGASASMLGVLMLLHFTGMFGLSRVVGRLADGWGRRPVIMAGLAVLALGALATSLPGLVWMAAGLLVVGLGWSFAYIGATVLFTDLSPPSGRAAALGRVDLAVALVAAGVSAGAGIVYGLGGRPALGLAAATLALLPMTLLSRRTHQPTPA